MIDEASSAVNRRWHEGRYSVFGIGNPLMDYVAYEEYELLDLLGATAGTMNLIDRDQRERLLARLKHYYTIPGGSCANTIRGIAWLAEADPLPVPCLSGAVGRDEIGDCYTAEIAKLGIESRIVRKPCETGVSTIIVTPDCERTMFTFLGACREFATEDLDLGILDQARCLHVAGYMWDTDAQKQATVAAVARARRIGLRISFDLADPFVVQRYREDFLEWIPGTVDVLFGNREEIGLMMQAAGAEDEQLIRRIGSMVPLVAMKVGARGCYVCNRGRVLFFPGVEAKAVDTTGAGDFFAAGFLFGLIKGEELEATAELANRFGAAIVEVEGSSLVRLDQREILLSSERH